MNQAYIETQKESFLTANRPPDFPAQGISEANFIGIASVEDITSAAGKRAMGFAAA